MTTKLTDKNISNVANLGIQWQAVITADGSTATTAVAGRGYLIDTTSNAHTINLPASAIAGDTIAIKDYAGTFGTNALTISRNGSNIQGVANDSQISTNRASVELIYVDSTKGWVYTNESNVADLEFATFISATGGTITTSGDYKIHSFTGDGCFVVSSLGGGGTPCAQATSVDYLVVAGGGAGANNGTPGPDGAGGGGAGGFRLSNSTCMPAPTTSPLANPTGLTVTATTYPVTVGAGGAGKPSSCSGNYGPAGNPGSNSIFSTITSAGGGGAGGTGPLGSPGGSPGGSGGGSHQVPFGTGNTPPVSPPQGNPGNGPNGSPYGNGGGGGGGAGAPGGPALDGGSSGGGGGGAGSYVVSSGFAGCNGTPGPVGSTRYFAGGGGGSNSPARSPSDVKGPGGAGGGGDGGGCGTANGQSATTNTGGGGGGAANCSGSSGSGGKGIVIIRYKYQ